MELKIVINLIFFMSRVEFIKKYSERLFVLFEFD